MAFGPIHRTPTIQWYSVQNLLHDFGKDDHISMCVGKMAAVMFLTPYRVCKQKQILASASVYKPNCL